MTFVSYTPNPTYIATGSQSVFAMLHKPNGMQRDVAVLLCAPFGWEDMCSYRSRLEWAIELAGAGYPTVRFDYPGSGDSYGGPATISVRDWTNSIACVATWLRRQTEVRRVVAIGIGLGGVLATRTACCDRTIDDLVLWGAGARGRTLVRELRAFARMESHRVDDAPEHPNQASSGITVGGYTLSEETLTSLQTLDFSELQLPASAERRVLILNRDDRRDDSALLNWLQASGAQLSVQQAGGYNQMMMAEPQDAVPARRTFALVQAWLDEGSRAMPAVAEAPASLERSCEVTLENGDLVRETAVLLPHEFGDMFGILTEPVSGSARMCAIWLNAGPQRHTGPNRIWVEAARRWATRGVASLRIDLAGIGDALGDSDPLRDPRSFFDSAYLDQAKLAVSFLSDRGIGQRYLVCGLCAGGYWALQLALNDQRVCTAVLLNPGLLVYDGGWSKAAADARVLAYKAFRPAAWFRVASGRSTLSAHRRTVSILIKGLWRWLRLTPARVWRASRVDVDKTEQAFQQLYDRDQSAVILFAGQERLYARLQRENRLEMLGGWPNVAVKRIDIPADVHTLRPLWLQRETHQLLDQALELALDHGGQRSATDRRNTDGLTSATL